LSAAVLKQQRQDKDDDIGHFTSLNDCQQQPYAGVALA
jgi:hypothetical protein